MSLHSTTPIPAPVRSRPHSTHRKLTCLAFPEHMFGEDAAASECLLFLPEWPLSGPHQCVPKASLFALATRLWALPQLVLETTGGFAKSSV